jgi:2-iminobutanoate/2-iminopropanoate deaminase
MPRRVIPTPNAPTPAGPYSPAVEGAGLVFLSGQVGAHPPATGRSAGEDVDAQAQQVLSNLGVILEDAGLGWDDVVKATIYLTDMGDFAAVNEVYAAAVGSSPPARSTVEVSALPLGYKVEIELVAAR